MPVCLPTFTAGMSVARSRLPSSALPCHAVPFRVMRGPVCNPPARRSTPVRHGCGGPHTTGQRRPADRLRSDDDDDFEVYRLHQLNRAAQLVAALTFSVRGTEATNQTLAIMNSLGALLTVLQILGVICVWSLSSFLMRFLPSSDIPDP